MRVTRDLLLNLAREQTAKLAAKDRSLQCVYLVGSLIHETPFLGGMTDVDLVCVHDRPVQNHREIIRINADVHLDIAHLSDETYDPPRRLRTDPWIGGSLDDNPLVLYDRSHWFDFTRSGTTSQFWQTQHVVDRARGFASHARQNWQTLTEEAQQVLRRSQLYLCALRDTANAPSSLNGNPLTVRRFMLDLPGRIAMLDLPEFLGSFVAQFANESVTPEQLEKWRTQWLTAFDFVKDVKGLPVQYLPARRNYYDKAITVLAVDHPAAALWILLSTWTEICAFLPKTESLYKDWQTFMRTLELDSKNLPEKLARLDALLDSVENNIDRWQEEMA
jgi:hypothetical protein